MTSVVAGITLCPALPSGLHWRSLGSDDIYHHHGFQGYQLPRTLIDKVGVSLDATQDGALVEVLGDIGL